MYILLDLLLQKKIPAIICIWYVYNTEICIILLAEFDCFRIQAVLLFTTLLLSGAVLSIENCVGQKQIVRFLAQVDVK